MPDYVFVDCLTPGLVKMRHPRYGDAVWHQVKLRRPARCARCRADLPTGTAAFSPIGNGLNRHHRLCVGCARA